MDLSGKPSSFETTSVEPQQRAGLRIAPAPGQPTGIFAVVEMAVLVIVTALAMVSIIVAGSETDSGQRSQPSNVGVEQRQDARELVRRDGIAVTYAAADATAPASRAAVEVAGR